MVAQAVPQARVRGRIALVAVFSAFAFALIGARLVDVAVFGAGGAASPHGMRVLAQRADLVDRNGVLIARDLPVHDLYARPAEFVDAGAAARALAAATGTDERRLARAFASGRGYVVVKRALAPAERDAVMRLGLPGLVFENNYRRYYAAGSIATHAVGQTDIDGNGLSGLELGLDALLKQSPTPVPLSLDLRVQYALARELAEGMRRFGARAAGGIVMNVHTGEILALVSLPDFEPNERSATPRDAARNRMAQDVYELGSIFKIFTFAHALDASSVRLDERIAVGEPLKLGRYLIRDSHRMGPELTAADVFAQSSNIGAAQIAARLGAARQHTFLATMGLLEAAKTELPESAAPLLPRHWGGVESATISYGHGISVSPLAFTAAAAAVVNGGTRMTPTFLKRSEGQRGERVLSESTSKAMRELMRLAVTGGTGGKAAVPGYAIGGKTGTAEKAEAGRYASKALISSFYGVVPIDNPEYAVFVMLDEPKGTKETGGFATAGYTSAPVAGRVIARIAPLLGIPRNDALAAATGQRDSTKEP
ncbi:MAG: peptidoglycan D,D-transpeptidase FtsI family protein [Alphaproteobacteria bacterium]